MNQVIADWSATGLLVNSLMGIFAGLGVVLAIVGVFGVMAYTVARRTHEIGIRMALGARETDVLRMVTWKGNVLGAFRGRNWPCAGGTAANVAAADGSSRQCAMV